MFVTDVNFDFMSQLNACHVAIAWVKLQRSIIITWLNIILLRPFLRCILILSLFCARFAMPWQLIFSSLNAKNRASLIWYVLVRNILQAPAKPMLADEIDSKKYAVCRTTVVMWPHRLLDTCFHVKDRSILFCCSLFILGCFVLPVYLTIVAFSSLLRNDTCKIFSINWGWLKVVFALFRLIKQWTTDLTDSTAETLHQNVQSQKK